MRQIKLHGEFFFFPAYCRFPVLFGANRRSKTGEKNYIELILYFIFLLIGFLSCNFNYNAMKMQIGEQFILLIEGFRLFIQRLAFWIL